MHRKVAVEMWAPHTWAHIIVIYWLIGSRRHAQAKFALCTFIRSYKKKKGRSLLMESWRTCIVSSAIRDQTWQNKVQKCGSSIYLPECLRIINLYVHTTDIRRSIIAKTNRCPANQQWSQRSSICSIWVSTCKHDFGEDGMLVFSQKSKLNIRE